MDGAITSPENSGPGDMRARGYKEVRRWVIDLDAPSVREQIRDSVNRINVSEEDAQILVDMEENTAELWAGLPE